MRNGINRSGHAIVGGFGHLGSRIAAQLVERGKEVVVVDSDSSEGLRARVRALGCKLIVGDIHDDAVIEAAGIGSACCFIAVTGDACANLEAAISARDMNGRASVVLRLFDQSLAGRIASGFGIQALSAASIASPAFVSAATDDSVVAAFTVDGAHLSLHRHERVCPDHRSGRGVTVLRDGSRLRTVGHDEGVQTGDCLFAELREQGRASQRRHDRQGKTISNLVQSLRDSLSQMSPAHFFDELAAAWRHAASVSRSIFVSLLGVALLSVVLFSYFGRLGPIDALYFVVTTMTTVGYGDFNLQNASFWLKAYGILMMLAGAALLATVYAIIADRVLTARVEHLLGRRGVDMQGHTVVVGLGSVGYKVAHDLRLLGIDVAGVEANEDAENLSTARAMFPVVIGNAAKQSILLKAGIDRADTVIALTDDPIVNLNVALHARECNSGIRTILRTYQPDLAEKFRKLGLDEVLSTSAIAAPTFVDVALYPGAQGSFVCGDHDVLVVRHHVDEESVLAGKTVQAAGDELGIAVVLLAGDRKGGYQIAAPDAVVRPGMKTVVLLARDTAEGL